MKCFWHVAHNKVFGYMVGVSGDGKKVVISDENGSLKLMPLDEITIEVPNNVHLFNPTIRKPLSLAANGDGRGGSNDWEDHNRIE